jgi:hypothetical protein
LSVEEWQVASYIHPKNTMRQVAKAVKMDDLEIRRVVYGFLQAGLVEIVRPEGALPASPPARSKTPQNSKEEQKSLINRLIDRIRSL